MAVASMLTVAAACGESNAKAATTVVKSSLPRIKTIAIRGCSCDATSRSIDDLGANLYRQLIATSDGGNVVFSPYSLEVALAMARLGAVGETRSQIDRVLGASGDDSLDQGLNALDQTLVLDGGPKSGATAAGGQKGTVSLRTANSIWGQRGESFERPFLDGLASNYGAGVRAVDFESNPSGSQRAVNAWVSDQTAKKIPELIPAGVIDRDTRLVLANALYFKAPWDGAFTGVGDRTFHAASGVASPVPTMTQSFEVDTPTGYGSGTGWQAGSIPYLGDQLSMVVIVPDDLATFERSFTGAKLASILGGLDGSISTVQMPTFSFRSTLSLQAQLSALGMPLAFSDRADFSGITKTDPLKISAVEHQAWIGVDEKGTEAAAATAEVFQAVGAPITANPPHPLIVDKPFLFAITDSSTRAVLFLGRVTDPAATSK